jgi:hypothetical protein
MSFRPLKRGSAPNSKRKGRLVRKFVVALLLVPEVLALSYVVVSFS